MATHKHGRGGGLVDDTAFVELSAYVAPTATVGARSYVGHGAYINPGVVVGSNVIICDRVRVIASVPNNTTVACDCCGGESGGDSVLTFDSIRVVGGQLASYDTTGKLAGQLAYVGNDTFANQNSVHDFYTLVYGENLTPDTFGTDVVNSPTFAVDGAQWRRNGVVDQQAIQKIFWSVDPANLSGVASDENTGWGASQATADAHPLRSMHALNGRLRGYAADLGLTIHLMSAFPDFTTWEVLTSLSTFTGTSNYVTFTGDYLPIDGDSAGNVLTAVQPAVPAANTERTITIAGLGNKPGYLNRMVRTADGSKTAYVTRQLAPDVFCISEPRSSDVAGGIGTVVDFANADVVDFVDLTRLCDWPFPSTGVPFGLVVKVRLDADGTGSHFPGGAMGGVQPTIGQCIFGNPTKAVTSFTLSAPNIEVITYSCQMSGQHANTIRGGNWKHYSLAVAVGGDGPLLADTTHEFEGELNITGAVGAESIGFRQLPGGPANLFFAGDVAGNRIATFGNITSTFFLWQANHAESGNFVVRTGLAGPTVFAWYGTSTGVVVPTRGLLTVGQGSRSQLPPSALLTVVALNPGICVDNVNFAFADVPISTPTGAFVGGDTSLALGNALNVGKQLVGGGTCISYGNQSPAVDAVPLLWAVGDKRRYTGAPVNAAIDYYVCTVAGTPGTWVPVA